MAIKSLTQITDYVEYFKELSKYQMDYLIIIASKGFLGSYHFSQFYKYDKKYSNYVSIFIVDDGEIISSEYSMTSLQHCYNNQSGIAIHISCASREYGNYAHIVFDGVDWCTNNEGINVVVIDKRRKVLIDSINFNTTLSDCPHFRNNAIDPFYFVESKINAIKKQNELDIYKLKVYIDAISNKLWPNGDYQKKIFESIPPSTGDRRIVQEAMISILKEFVAICDENNIQYWLNYGTLIGAIRHQGIIPWDGDIDISMIKSDFDKLYEILKNNPMLNISMTVKSYRVIYRVIHKKYLNPFVDIYCNEFNTYDIADATKERGISRKKFVDKFNTPRIAKDGYYICKDEYKQSVDAANDYGCIAGHTDNIEDALTIVLSPNQPGKGVLEKDIVFPLRKTIFEGLTVWIPNKSEELLERTYGNIYCLPDDVFTHRNNKLTPKEIENSKKIMSEHKRDV